MSFTEQCYARKIAAQENACEYCAFYSASAPALCFAPWSDAYMEDQFIDPCFEGVYKKLTGRSAPALAAVERERERIHRHTETAVPAGRAVPLVVRRLADHWKGSERDES